MTVTPGRGEEGADLDGPPLPASNGQHRPELPRLGVEAAAPRPSPRAVHTPQPAPHRAQPPRLAQRLAPPLVPPGATLPACPAPHPSPATPRTAPRPAPRPAPPSLLPHHPTLAAIPLFPTAGSVPTSAYQDSWARG